MTFNVRFGPAGNPLGYRGKTTKVCDYIKKIGLDAYEYQATYGVRISKKSGVELGENAKKNDVLISMHAPYYINLCSNKNDVIERSIDRLVQSARASEWMNAYRIVFHPGFYTEYSPNEAREKMFNTIRELIEKIERLGIKKYTFAPETTGKKSQYGNLEEIIDLCQSFENFAPTVDFGHLHARSNGNIRNREDYEKIFNKIDSELGLQTLHCHFTKVEFSDAGERRHHTLLEEDFGPPLEPLLELVVDCGWDVTFISETPLLDEDALIMKVRYENISGKA
ncbi:MAG: TIM barrel protein [Euryarchaeota archaeon]|nr:TIM barrel protein [Euryarchaeota archaeon]